MCVKPCIVCINAAPVFNVYRRRRTDNVLHAPSAGLDSGRFLDVFTGAVSSLNAQRSAIQSLCTVEVNPVAFVQSVNKTQVFVSDRKTVVGALMNKIFNPVLSDNRGNCTYLIVRRIILIFAVAEIINGFWDVYFLPS